MDALRTFLGLNLRQWLSVKGIAMVVVVALVPFALTGVWVATHQADVEVATLSWSPEAITEGDDVTFTAVFRNAGDSNARAFNGTLVVGRLSGTALLPDAQDTSEIQGLGARGEATRTLDWTARPGVYWVLARADVDDDIGEKDEFNNDEYHPVAVQYKPPTEEDAPRAPENLTGNETAAVQADAAVTGISASPETYAQGDLVTFTATATNAGPGPLENATLVIEHGRVQLGEFFPLETEERTLTLQPDETGSVELSWQAANGVHWIRAHVRLPDGAHDPDGANNHLSEPVVVQPAVPADFQPPELPEKRTLKEFYLEFLSRLHLQVLLPFLALFYAGGVLADEKNRGNLTYLLTRPVGRWWLPVAKFLAGFLLSGVAVTLGLVASFLLLFGAGASGDVGFLVTPILMSWLTLFLYGAFFALLGVLVTHPYIVGIVFVLAWERLAFQLMPWVGNLTLTHWLATAIQSWPLDQGVRFLPDGDEAVRALLTALGLGVAFLVAAAVTVSWREFEES